jgi:gamma-glutamyltranspeptidase/glutathione hydrolase
MTAEHPPLTWPATGPHRPGRSAFAARTAIVASTDALASRVGLDALADGGNAVDAAVAVAFALAVVNPEAGNVGGGGFMTIRTAAGETAALDYRSAAPRAATPDLFRTEGEEADDRSEVGHLAAAVPGSVRGLWEAHRRFGARGWGELVEPAVALARGFLVTERFTRSFPPHIVDGLRRFPESAGTFLPGGRVPRVGETFGQTELAATLERIRDHGADGFYRGATAERIAAEMRRGGGLIDLDDLASYEARWREPMRVAYREHTIVCMPPSSSGGATLAAMAGVLEGYDLGDLPWHDARHVHLLAEAWKRAFADRNHYLADPDAVPDIPLETLASRAYGAWRARDIRPASATPSADVGPGVEAYRATRAGSGSAEPVRPTGAAPFREGTHTTHVSIVDGARNAVAMTTTLNTWYGSKLVVPGTGVLLNNEMDDFTTRPGTPNHFGLVQGEANRVAPGKRMLSAMTPTLLLDPDDRLALVVGSPGGATIITTVFQVVSNLVDHGMGLADAVNAPRVHHQHLPDVLEHEPGGLEPAVVAALEEMGHRVRPRERPWGDVQAVSLGADGTLLGQADPRRGGVALGM